MIEPNGASCSSCEILCYRQGVFEKNAYDVGSGGDPSGQDTWFRSESIGGNDHGITTLLALAGEFTQLLRRHGIDAELRKGIGANVSEGPVDVLVELGTFSVLIIPCFESGHRPTRSELAHSLHERPATRGLPIEATIHVISPRPLASCSSRNVRLPTWRCLTSWFSRLSMPQKRSALWQNPLPNLGVPTSQRGTVAPACNIFARVPVEPSRGQRR